MNANRAISKVPEGRHSLGGARPLSPSETVEAIGYSAKRAGVKRACPNKVMAHMWFMHDAHLGRAFLLLGILAEYALLSMTVMVTPCLWYVVGMKLVMSYVKLPQAPFARAPFTECRAIRIAAQKKMRTNFCVFWGGGGGERMPVIRIAAMTQSAGRVVYKALETTRATETTSILKRPPFKLL